MSQKKFGFSSRSTKLSKNGSLNLTPMIDVMTIMLIFLIKNYAVSPVFLTATQEIELAHTTSEQGAPDEAYLIVGHEGIIVEGVMIVSFDGKTASNSLLRQDSIPELLLALQGLSEKRKSEEKESETLILQADKSLSYASLKPILRTAGLAGFNDIKFAGMGD